MGSVIVEIRIGQGGDDSKLLVEDQFDIYCRWSARRGLSLEPIEESAGLRSFRVSGQGAEASFRNEAGCHRVQRVPPTEKRGRVHSSTITVAVMAVPEPTALGIAERDLEWAVTRGSGAGGQHRNVTNSAVQLKHVPTGISVRIESERSQHQNKEVALEVLRARLAERMQAEAAATRNDDRRAQVGNGTRNERRRTVAFQRDEVVDHILNRKLRVSDYLAGKLDKLSE